MTSDLFSLKKDENLRKNRSTVQMLTIVTGLVGDRSSIDERSKQDRHND
jgi:hypothetical protein